MKTSLVLTCAHTHAGRLHLPGARIEVDADLAQWLLSIGSARVEPPAPKSEISGARAAPSILRKDSKS